MFSGPCYTILSVGSVENNYHSWNQGSLRLPACDRCTSEYLLRQVACETRTIITIDPVPTGGTSTSPCCTATNTRRPSALEALWVHNITTEVTRCSRPVGKPHVDIVQPDIGARRDGTALEAGDVAALRRPPRVPDLEVPDLELRVCAVARPRRA